MSNEEYLKSLPFGSDFDPLERIVCAANKYDHDIIILGVRHGCDAMSDVFEYYDENCPYFLTESEIQGFMTSKHRFVDRYEAWKIALEQRQIVRLVGGNEKEKLYSENLY